MYLTDIIDVLGIEDLTTECKARLDRDDSVSWLKTIAGFANAKGGDFYIGVEDKSGKLMGFDRKGADNERNYFNNQVNQHISPRPLMNISFMPYQVRDKDLYVIKVSVGESNIKPVLLKHNGIPAIFMRRDGFTNGATSEEIIEMSITSSRSQYDVIPSGEKYEHSSFSSLRDFFSKNNSGKALSDKALRSMGFFDEDGILANGALLFKDNYEGGRTDIQCSLFNGFNRGSERVVTITRFEGNLQSEISEVMEFLKLRMNHGIVKLPQGRLNIDAYPERALFEGVVNAIAHRDYFQDGTQIQIEMFRDRLEISSPGGFYRGEWHGRIKDLSKLISKRRNELICSVLVACNCMEAAGTGFDKIMEEYKNADERHKPFVVAATDHFTLTLPDLTWEQGLQEEGEVNLSHRKIPDGTAYDDSVLSYCFRRRRKVADIARHLGVSNSSYLRTRVLGNLEANGYLKTSKEGNAKTYITDEDAVIIN